MIEIINDPEVQTTGAAFLGALAAIILVPLFAWLKSKVSKTETKLDDNLVAALEEAVNKAIAQKKKK
jgi:ABC-type Fe3+-siderophore transport system permease subunit